MDTKEGEEVQTTTTAGEPEAAAAQTVDSSKVASSSPSLFEQFGKNGSNTYCLHCLQFSYHLVKLASKYQFLSTRNCE